MNKITLGFFLANSKTTIKGLLVLSVLLFMNTQVTWGQISISGTGSGNTYIQDFNMLDNSVPSSTLPAGWVFEETGGDTTYEVDNGQSTIASTYSYGTGLDTDRALGILRSSTVEPALGVSFTNNTGGLITELVISYTGEQWRLGDITRPIPDTDGLRFSYSFDAISLLDGAATWTHSTHLSFNSPITTGTVGALDGNAIDNKVNNSFTLSGLSIAPGQTFWFRFNDYNNLTANDGLAVDDFSVYAIAPTVWNGLSWSIGAPNATVEAIIDGTYNTNAGGSQVPFTTKKLTVNSGKSLTINSGTNVTVQYEIINNGSLVVENNANLIQSTGAENTGAITVKRDSNPLYRSDYTLWSSPVASQNLLAFSPLTNTTRFYSWDNTAGTAGLYSIISDPSLTAFAAGNGYLIRMPNEDPSNLGGGSPYVLGGSTLTYNGVFTGVPNNGNIPVTLNYGIGAAHAYNLVGNPYPSVIDADMFINENGIRIESTLYFWRKTNAASGSAYATYTFGSGGTAAGSSEIPNGKIQVGQGFIVQAKYQDSFSNFFTNGMRALAPTSTQFFKTKQIAQKDRVWLNLTNTIGVFSQALVAYITDATLGVDKYDGKYINDSPIALTSNINNEEYTIQGRPAFDAFDVVALNFKTNVAGNYTIAIDHADGLLATAQEVFLVDSKTGTETNLKTSAYTFTAASGIDNARFSLKYQKTLKVDVPTFNENSVSVYKNNGTLYVNSGAVAIANIKVFDIQGRLIAERNNVKANTATINNLKATQQVLIVKVTGQDNAVVSKKVLD
ncbi:MAG: T9SS sorting signal type C domain-containing protein [Flavobacteriaceae bacterium]|nr:T9SS sorting signal type C domain-containing protein [Flavobacteriaceae bacterium]